MPLQAPPAELASASPAFQAGFAAGQKDARRHRRRGFVITDLPGLSAYAADAAELNTGRGEREREALITQYAEGYLRAYRVVAGW